jgi:hypothetical protein
MNRVTNFKALSRAVAVIAAVLIVVSGVTFAALQSQQDKLTGNIIQTTTADLEISLDDNTYANSEPGFEFDNIIPGGAESPRPAVARCRIGKHATNFPTRRCPDCYSRQSPQTAGGSDN